MMTSGNYVELIGFGQTDPNSEKNVIVEALDTGRLCVELGPHEMMIKVCVQPANLPVIASSRAVKDVQRRRDQGQSVASLLSQGYSVAAIQRDDSMILCAECARPRYVCSRTFQLMK